MEIIEACAGLADHHQTWPRTEGFLEMQDFQCYNQDSP